MNYLCYTKPYYTDGVGRNKKLPYLCAKIKKVNIYIITMRTRQGRVRAHERDTANLSKLIQV